MNTIDLKAKIGDVVALLEVYCIEVDRFEEKQVALEKSSQVNTDREKRLNDLQKTLVIKEEELRTQEEYIDKKNTAITQTVGKLASESNDLLEKKAELKKEQEQLEEDKKSFVLLQQEKEQLEREKIEFSKQKSLFEQEKTAMKELQKLLVMREANTKAREERIDKIERMTGI